MPMRVNEARCNHLVVTVNDIASSKDTNMRRNLGDFVVFNQEIGLDALCHIVGAVTNDDAVLQQYIRHHCLVLNGKTGSGAHSKTVERKTSDQVTMDSP